MRILDQNENELLREDLDFERGYLANDTLFAQHHEAIEAAPEEGHWETVAEYPNGGKDIKWVIDVPKVEPKEAWNEYEDIQRYIPYTEEELAAREAEKQAAEEEAELQRRIRALPDTAVTWDDLAKAIAEGVNSI